MEKMMQGRSSVPLHKTLRKAFAGLCLAFAALATTHAHAQSVEEFYKGKTLTAIVGNGPGGGFDFITRLVARHITQYIPGHPSIVVQNMPGAGTLLLANYLYNIAPKDGTTFGLIARNLPMMAMTGGNANVRFDPRKMTWLGSSSNFSGDAYVLIVRDDAPIKTIEDARRPDGPALLIGGTSDGQTSADVPKILRDTLKLNMKLVLGYRDSAALFLAMERGEIMGRMVELSAVRSMRAAWLKPGGGYHLLAQYARVTRLPDFPNVPTARELAPDDKSRALIAFTETPLLTMSWPFTAPPGIPADRVQALRQAFAEVHRDPKFLQEAKAAGFDIDFVSGEDVTKSVDELAKAPPEFFDYVRNLLGTKKKS
jgi:tripartite-type tricarboxylate transporter receptor subunit TctC